MANITKGDSINENRINTNVVSKQKNIGEVKEPNFNSNLNKILNLTPEISKIIDSVAIAKQEAEKNKLLNEKKIKEKLKEDTEKGIEKAEQGFSDKDIIDDNVKNAFYAKNNNVQFIENFNKELDENFDKYSEMSEVEFRNSIKDKKNNFEIDLIDKKVFTEKQINSESYILSSEMTFNIDSIVNKWIEKKGKDEVFKSEQALNSYINSEIASVNKPEDFYNLLVNSKANLKRVGYSNIDNSKINKTIINSIESKINNAKSEDDINKLDIIFKGSEIPYDGKNEKFNFKNANYELFERFNKKKEELKSKKDTINYYEINKIKDELEKGNFDNFEGKNNLNDRLKNANASDSEIGLLSYKLDKRIEKNNEIDKKASLFSLTDKNKLNIFSRVFQESDNEDKDKIVNTIYNKNSENPENLNSENNLLLAMDIKENSKRFPDIYKKTFDIGFYDMKSPESMVVNKAIQLKKKEGYTTSNIAEFLGVDNHDIIRMEYANEISSNSSLTIQEKYERLDNLNRKKELYNEKKIDLILKENKAENSFKKIEEKILDNIDIDESDPMYKVVLSKTKKILGAEYIYSDYDLEKSYRKAEYLVSNEFLKIGDNTVLKTQEMKVAELENKVKMSEIIDYNLNKAYDEIINNDSNFFKSIYNYTTTNIGLSYDEEYKKYYLVDDNIPIQPNKKQYDLLNKQTDTNMFIENGRFYIDDITKRIDFSFNENKENAYDFDKINRKDFIFISYKNAYKNEKLDEKFNFLIDERFKTNDVIYDVTSNDLEDANEILNSYIGKNLKEKDVRVINKYSSQIANKEIKYSLDEWKKILKAKSYIINNRTRAIKNKKK